MTRAAASARSPAHPFDLTTNMIQIPRRAIQIPHLPIPHLHRCVDIQHRRWPARRAELKGDCWRMGSRREGTRDGPEVEEDDLRDEAECGGRESGGVDDAEDGVPAPGILRAVWETSGDCFARIEEGLPVPRSEKDE
jgi:hypothetical protein